jgi:hypothetical protein
MPGEVEYYSKHAGRQSLNKSSGLRKKEFSTTAVRHPTASAGTPAELGLSCQVRGF